MISFRLGAGRLRKEDLIDYQAGVYLNKVKNEYVKKGDVIATLYSSRPIDKSLVNDFMRNVMLASHPHKDIPMIIKVMR
jgi:pyrimidine-nucleoside phosphorylase